jgi:hypothetical protein
MKARTGALLAAALVVLALAQTAAASELEVSPAGAIEAASEGAVSFAAGAVTGSCRLTLRGSFNSLIVKVGGNAVGSVTNLAWRDCTGGTINGALGFPWSITYSSILGALPNQVTGLLAVLHGMQVSWLLFGFITCLYRGDLQVLFPFSGSNPYTTSRLNLVSGFMTLVSGTGCDRSVDLFGNTFSFTRQTIRRI